MTGVGQLMLKGRTITSYYMSSNKIPEYINGSVAYMNQTELVIRQKLDELIDYMSEVKNKPKGYMGYTLKQTNQTYQIDFNYGKHKIEVKVDEGGTITRANAYILGIFPKTIRELEGTNVNNLALSQWSDILSK